MQLFLFNRPTVSTTALSEHRVLEIRKKVAPHIPDPALNPVTNWFHEHCVNLVIRSERITKSGDFRILAMDQVPVISINRTLNPYAFLITLIHEMAHAQAHEKLTGKFTAIFPKKRKDKPHGAVWKTEFKQCMFPYLVPEIFPEEILSPLRVHMKNPRASTFSDLHLSRVLEKYNVVNDYVLLENLPEGSLFTALNGKLFLKKERIKTRFRCICLKNEKNYLFSPVANVLVTDLPAYR